MNIRTLTTSLLAVVALVFVLSPAASAALTGPGGIIAPTGTNPETGEAWKAGDTYHLVFLTEGTTQATSSDIATYNAFVNAEAALSALQGVSSLTWYVVASTNTVNAVANAPVSAPVYLLNGNLVASDASVFYGSPVISNLIQINQHGVTSSVNNPWTGSRRNGTLLSTSRGLGTSSPSFGASGTNNNYIESFAGGVANTQFRPLYGMSGPLTVIPEPASLVLFGLGGLLMLKRRK